MRGRARSAADQAGEPRDPRTREQMARMAAAGPWSLWRASARSVRCWPRSAIRLATVFAALLILVGSSGAARCENDPVKGEATLSAAGGYARLVIKLADEVESEVTAAGSILVIRFKHPVDVPVEAIADAAPDYVGSARRDPDGMAI